jgi:cytochrome c oxidase cbb3-type subunit 3
MFMPCRITAVERDGVVRLMSINPRYMARLYNNSEINEACHEMYDIYVNIMEEATL